MTNELNPRRQGPGGQAPSNPCAERAPHQTNTKPHRLYRQTTARDPDSPSSGRPPAAGTSPDNCSRPRLHPQLRRARFMRWPAPAICLSCWSSTPISRHSRPVWSGLRPSRIAVPGGRITGEASVGCAREWKAQRACSDWLREVLPGVPNQGSERLRI